MDHYFRDGDETGLEWLRSHQNHGSAYLCTTAYSGRKVQEQAMELGLKIIPKPLIQSVTITRNADGGASV